MKHVFVIKNILTGLVLIFCTTHLEGQTASAELQKVKDAYGAVVNLSATVNVSTWETPTSAKVLMGTGEFHKGEDGYYSKFMTDEMVSNNRCAIIVDHAEKSITYFDKTTQDKRRPQFDPPSVDSLLHLSDSVKYNGVRDGKNMFIFYKGSGMVRRTELFTDPSTHLILKIIYYYAPSGEDEDYGIFKAEIVYSNYSTTKPEERFFSEKQFVEKKGDAMTPSAAFKTYQLIKAQ